MTLNDERDLERPQSFAPLKQRKRPVAVKVKTVSGDISEVAQSDTKADAADVAADVAADAANSATESAATSAANSATESAATSEKSTQSKVASGYLSPDLPETELSIADLSRKHANPKRWCVYFGVLLVAIVFPYWVGRTLAVRHTSWVVSHFAGLSPQGVVFISWVITVAVFTSLAMALIESNRWVWRFLFVIFLALEQLVAGLCMLSMSFWYSTYVVYGSASGLANAANLGIISAGLAVAVFAVLFVGLLVTVPKKSPLNVLTRSWVSFIMFYTVEVLAILVVLFGGFMTAM